MKSYLTVLFSISVVAAFGNEAGREKILVKEAHGIVLLGPSAGLLTPKELKAVCGVERVDLSLPGSFNQLKRKISPFLNEPITNYSLEQIQQKIKAFYLDHAHPFVLVEVPQRQDITEGVVQIRVIESEIGEISVSGNHWNPSKRLIQFVGLKSEETLDTSKLLRNLYNINQSSFFQTDLIFSPGKATHTTDVTLVVDEMYPIQGYVGSDNTGIESIGRERWFVGLNWGNAFGLGHTLSTQYTASYHFHRFQAITVQYLAPLSWGHLLNIYGGYSEVHPKLHIQSMKNHGWSCQGSLRYQIPLPLSRRFEQDISVGGDFKRTNNTFEFTDFFPRIAQNVNLTQFAVEYEGNYRGNSYQLEFDGSLFYSPGSWLPDQSNHAYKQLRRGAIHRWVYFRGGFAYLQRLPYNISLYLLNRGQISSQNLLPSEQYGIGGYDTVRGYEERQLNKDTALLSSLELRSPSYPLSKLFGAKNPRDGLELHGFIDWGWGKDHKADVPGFKTEYLLGAGPGIRYYYDRYLSARFDLGFKLHKDHYQGGNPMIHFSVIGSY